MRKVAGVVLYIIAGYFFCMVNLLGFVNEPTIGKKWEIMITFAVPAFLALGCGLALGKFRNWKMEIGIVLLCASGLMACLAFTLACLLLTEDFRKLMGPDALIFFSDHFTGIAVMVVYAGLGWFLLKTNRKYVEQIAPADAPDSGAPLS
jgi:hypothetical protein